MDGARCVQCAADESCDNGTCVLNTGAVLAAVALGDGHNESLALFVDGGGYIYLAGSYSSDTQFGNDTLPSVGPPDIFLSRYSPTHNHLWSRAFGGPGPDYGFGVAVASDGSVYLVGTAEGPLSFDGPVIAAAGGQDAIVAKYDHSGAHQWSKSFGGSGIDRAQDAALDAAGNLYVTGRISPNADLGSGAVPGKGNTDSFVLKLSSSGSVSWARTFGTAGAFTLGYKVAVCGDGSIIAAGRYQGPVDFGGGALPHGAGYGFYVSKLTSAGEYVWAKGFYSNGGDGVADVVCTADNAIYVAGFLNEFEDQLAEASIGGAQLRPKGRDGVVLRMTSSGAISWSKLVGGSGFDLLGGISILSDQPGVYLAGSYDKEFVLCEQQMPTGVGIYAGALSDDGDCLWSRGFRAEAETTGIETASGGRMLISGTIYSPSAFDSFDIAPSPSDGFNSYLLLLAK